MTQLLTEFWSDETGAISVSYAIMAATFFASTQAVRFLMGILDDMTAGIEAQLTRG